MPHRPLPLESSTDSDALTAHAVHRWCWKDADEEVVSLLSRDLFCVARCQVYPSAPQPFRECQTGRTPLRSSSISKGTIRCEKCSISYSRVSEFYFNYSSVSEINSISYNGVLEFYFIPFYSSYSFVQHCFGIRYYFSKINNFII